MKLWKVDGHSTCCHSDADCQISSWAVWVLNWCLLRPGINSMLLHCCNSPEWDEVWWQELPVSSPVRVANMAERRPARTLLGEAVGIMVRSKNMLGGFRWLWWLWWFSCYYDYYYDDYYIWWFIRWLHYFFSGLSPEQDTIDAIDHTDPLIQPWIPCWKRYLCRQRIAYMSNLSASQQLLNRLSQVDFVQRSRWIVDVFD